LYLQKIRADWEHQSTLEKLTFDYFLASFGASFGAVAGAGAAFLVSLGASPPQPTKLAHTKAANAMEQNTFFMFTSLKHPVKLEHAARKKLKPSQPGMGLGFQ